MAVKKSTDIFGKCFKFNKAKMLISQGLYPYFMTIESAQDPEIIMNGRRMIMVGSNNYLGLTNHPKVKEAAIEAIRKYGTGCAGFLKALEDEIRAIPGAPSTTKSMR